MGGAAFITEAADWRTALMSKKDEQVLLFNETNGHQTFENGWKAPNMKDQNKQEKKRKLLKSK